MLNTIISKIRNYKFRKYIQELQSKGLKIGKNTHILDGAFLDPSHCFLISIGDNCTLAPNVRIIAHDASMFRFLSHTKIGRVKIHDNCFIGDSVIILPGVSIGPNAVVGAGSIVTHDIPPNSVAAGAPAKVLTTLNEFLKMHSENIKKNRCFPVEQFDISVISDKDKAEMLLYLDKNTGYLKKRLSKQLKNET